MGRWWFEQRWGVEWVLSSLAFEKHIKALMQLREKLEKKGIKEKAIKKVLFMRCRYWYVSDDKGG